MSRSSRFAGSPLAGAGQQRSRRWRLRHGRGRRQRVEIEHAALLAFEHERAAEACGNTDDERALRVDDQVRLDLVSAEGEGGAMEFPADPGRRLQMGAEHHLALRTPQLHPDRLAARALAALGAHELGVRERAGRARQRHHAVEDGVEVPVLVDLEDDVVGRARLARGARRRLPRGSAPASLASASSRSADPMRAQREEPGTTLQRTGPVARSAAC